MKLIDLLKEVGEASAKTYDWKNTVNNEWIKKYVFKTDSDLGYELDIEMYDRGRLAVVKFGVIEGDDDYYSVDYKAVPTKGELYRVMATVVEILKNFVNKNNEVEKLHFTTEKAGKNDLDSSRVKLFHKYIQTHLPNANVETWSIGGEDTTVVNLK